MSEPAYLTLASICGIDNERFIEARDMMEEVMPLMVSHYLEDSRKYIDAITEAIKSGRPSELKLPAHTLKSSSRQLGALKLGELAMELERCSHGDSWHEVDMQQLLAGVNESFAAAARYYRAYLQEVQAP